MPKIEKLVPGQSPSLLDADKANELVNMINGMLSSRAQDPIKLSVNSDGSFDINVNLTPIELTVCRNGELLTGVFYFQPEQND